MNCPTCGLDIDEHPANRCLDAWVAGAVFKRQVKYVPPEELPPAGKIDGVPILRRHGVWLLDDYDPEQDGITVSLWDVPASHVSHYSTDIVAAWKIVETLRCGWRGHAAACIDIKISDWVSRPDCQVTIFAPDIVDVKAEAYSPCLAICRAALKVKL